MVSVTFDFENLYPTDDISPDLRVTTFRTVLNDGSELPLKVEIESEAEELLPDVYNLAFGPMNAQEEIDDKAQVSHQDYSKCFSTILFSGVTYLQSNPDDYLGVDGSDNRRATLYYRQIQTNYDYLEQFFEIYGIKYYVRITRFGKRQYDNPFDFKDIFAKPERILKRAVPRMMYNYFIFRLKPAEQPVVGTA